MRHGWSNGLAGYHEHEGESRHREKSPRKKAQKRQRGDEVKPANERASIPFSGKKVKQKGANRGYITSLETGILDRFNVRGGRDDAGRVVPMATDFIHVGSETQARVEGADEGKNRHEAADSLFHILMLCHREFLSTIGNFWNQFVRSYAARPIARNPEGCQKAAGGRSNAQSSGMRQKFRAPWRGARFWHPFRMQFAFAARFRGYRRGSTPGYGLASLRDARGARRERPPTQMPSRTARIDARRKWRKKNGGVFQHRHGETSNLTSRALTVSPNGVLHRHLRRGACVGLRVR